MNGLRKTEIYCHDCNSYFTVELDFDLNGNHEIKCPACSHIHYRVIENGRVTGERYNTSLTIWTYSFSSYSSNYQISYDYTSTRNQSLDYGYVGTWTTVG